MFQEILIQIGLTLNESKVYEALLNLGEVNVSKISIKSKVHRRNVYDALNTLVDKGLASETFTKKEKLFRGIDPQKLKDLIKEKETALDSYLPAMKIHTNQLKLTRKLIFLKVQKDLKIIYN